MKHTNLGKFTFVVLVVVWALFEMYPPTSRDLIQQFAARAENQDATFTNILQRAEAFQKAGTNSEFACLLAATGTNSLAPYFQFIDAKDQLDPNLYILNRLQRDASGKIKLGLDLQGGTSFLCQMDTSKLTNTNDISGALSQAIGVLRKRVDAFGVAEPVIQSAGGNRILVQLPGLSEAVKESAKEQIQKAAYLEFRMVKDDSSQIVDEKTGKILQPIPPGYEVLKQIEMHPNSPPVVDAVVVKKKAEDGLAGERSRQGESGEGEGE